MSTFTSRGRIARGFLAAALVTCISLGAAGNASAAAPECTGKGVPTSKISVQLWTFAEHIGFGEDPATIARTEEVLAALAEMGYRNVEPFTLSGLEPEEYRALLDKYGLKASARHVDVGTPENPADIDKILADNTTRGIKYFGSGSTPIFPPIYDTEAEWIAYAEYLDELGAQARQAGQTLMVHNHDIEFETVFGDRTAFDILVEHTDPRNVVFQLDLFWAVDGLGSQEAALDLLDRLGKRVQLFHVKDMAGDELDNRIEIVGEGILDFPEFFATQGPARYYVVEHDPRWEDPTFDPFEAAEKGFNYLDCVTYR